MKKLFNNSTKGNETRNQSSKSKRKFLKTFSFASLALLMGAAGTMAFAPLDSCNVARASELETTTTSGLGLDPKDDMLIYSNEQGLKVKYHNSIMSNSTVKIPYFQFGMYNNFPVNWVVVGVSSGSLEYPSFEKTTPAGIALADENPTCDFFARLSNFSVVVNSTEIPSGYVLCTTECYLGTSKWSSSDGGGNNTWTSSINSRYTSISATITEAQKSLIKDNKFFGFSYSSSFKVSTYLTTNALRISYNIGTTTAGWWWTNQASSNYKAYAINSSGGIDGSSGENVVGKDDVSLGIRPCMLLKIT